MVDVGGRGAQNRHVLRLKAHGQVIGYLSAGRDDHASRNLQIGDVQHPLERQLVEVEPVADVVVGRDRLGIVVDHHRAKSLLADRVQRADAAPVELDRTSDAVGSRPEHDDRAVVVREVDVVRRGAVGDVQVVRHGRVLGRQRVDLLDVGRDAAHFAVAPDREHVGVDALGRALGYRAGELEIREAALFGLEQQLVGHMGDVVVLLQLVLDPDDVLQLLEEPAVDLRQLVDALDGVPVLQRVRDDEDALVGRMGERGVDVVDLELLVRDEAVHALSDHPQALLDHFLEVTADGHHLADGLHARSQLARDALELA